MKSLTYQAHGQHHTQANSYCKDENEMQVWNIIRMILKREESLLFPANEEESHQWMGLADTSTIML